MSIPTYVIDFECYYDERYHLKKGSKGLTNPEFVLDRRFKSYGMAMANAEGAWWVDAEDVPGRLEQLKDAILVFHNAYFDATILRFHYDFVPQWMLCTLLMANHVYGPRGDGGSGNDLKSLSKRLGLEPKGDLSFMRGVDTPSPEQKIALVDYAKTDARIGWAIYHHLLPLISNKEMELWLIDHTIRTYVTKQLQLEPAVIGRAKEAVERRRTDLVAAAGVDAKVLNSNKQFAAELKRRLEAIGQKLPMKRRKPTAQEVKKLKTEGKFLIPPTVAVPSLGKLEPAFLKLAEHENPAIANLVKGRLVQRSAVTALSRLGTMEKYLQLGVGIPVHLVYYGAHTGRFSGGGGFNLQNLTSPDRATDPVDREIATYIRGALSAGPGRTFVAVDAAQIECRNEAWLAGEQQILDDFASGADLYSKFISGVLGEDIHKPKGDEPPDVAKHLKLMRHVGKESVLGLGYQLGSTTFLRQLRAKSRDVARLIDAGKIDQELADKIVTAYREKYTTIVKWWARLMAAFEIAYGGSRWQVGNVLFRSIGDKEVGVRLPSGRELYYRNVRFEWKKVKGEHGSFQRKEWLHSACAKRVYGGSLAENITQAVSRDVLTEAMYACELEGYPVNLTIHDEVVCNVPTTQGQDCLRFLLNALSTPPDWGKGMVLGAEGRVSPTMSK